MSGSPVVYIVDDDTDARDSACALVSEISLRAIAFSSAEEFLNSYDGYRQACLLTDHHMLGMTGVELLETLRANEVSLAVVVMTAFAETELTVRAIRSGAVTLLEKPFSNTALWRAIHQALSEDRHQFADEAKLLLIRKRLDSLTESEREVLTVICRGEPNKSVALKLDVSVRTVEGRRSSIFEKTGVFPIAELVQLVMIARPELC